MKKHTGFCVAYSSSIVEFQEKVNALIANGWVLHGSMVLVYSSNDGLTMMYQALVWLEDD